MNSMITFGQAIPTNVIIGSSPARPSTSPTIIYHLEHRRIATPPKSSPSDQESSCLNESPEQSAVTNPAAVAPPGAPHADEIPGDLYCPKCGYNLRGLTSDKCPECGYDVTIVRRAESLLPWVNREKLGWLRAYWKTVWMVIFRSEQFSLEICRPVSEPDARRFRLVTMLHAYVPLVLLTVLWPIGDFNSFKITADFAGYGLIVAIQLGIIACIVLTTAVPHYALYHRDIPLVKRNRAAVLALYACAPLAWMFLVALFATIGVALTGMYGDEFGPPLSASACFITAFVLFVAILAALLMDLHRNVRRMFRESGPVWWVTFKLSVLWFFAGFVTLIGIPLAYLLLAVVFYSLT